MIHLKKAPEKDSLYSEWIVFVSFESETISGTSYTINLVFLNMLTNDTIKIVSIN
jgi:uncharacterized surface anchored protein